MTTENPHQTNGDSERGSLGSKQLFVTRWLLGLAVLYTLYFAQSLMLPLLFTGLIALLLSPMVTLLKTFHVPRSISSFLFLGLLIAPFTFLGIELAEPAQKWAQMLPKLSVQITHKIDTLSNEFAQQEAEAKKLVMPVVQEESGFNFFGWFDDDEEEVEEVEKDSSEEDKNVVKERIKQGGMEMVISILSAAPLLLAQVLTSIILILFLLIFGPPLFDAFVNHFPMVKNKQRAIYLVGNIQKALSSYIVTVSIINTVLGLSTALALQLYGMEDALLWGVLVGFLNFVPYVGSLVSLSILSVASVVQYGFESVALIPLGIFLFLNMIESQFITPTILGRSMEVNPLVIVLWLLVLGWLWGILGVLIAVPLLVSIKITLRELDLLPHWQRLIESSG